MTPEQKQSFYDDGFLIFRDIIPPEVVNNAVRTLWSNLSAVWQSSMATTQRDSEPNQEAEARRIKAAQTAMQTGIDPAITALADDESDLMRSIAEALGNPVFKPRRAQLANIFPNHPRGGINESGYPADEVPFYSWHGHLDGLWNGASPMHQRTDRGMNAEELAKWNRDPAKNGVRRTYPGNVNVLNFTALLGIPLSDQMQEGAGNVGLLRGAHHPMSRFFRYQREKGGPLGPDGPDWERIDTSAPNRGGLRHYPEQVRSEFTEGAAYTQDGRMWPKPELIKMKPGDAVLALHAVPHSATRLEGHSPRLMAYFRLVSSARDKDNAQLNADALCDCWLEWDGMREVVASNQRN